MLGGPYETNLAKFRFFNLNVKREIVHFILSGRVFHSPAVLLKKYFLMI